MNSVWPKFAILVACTLSGARTDGGRWELAYEDPFNQSTCSPPCADVGAHLRPSHLVPPFIVAVCAWLPSALPTLILSRSEQARGVRACVWPLLQLWLHLLVARVGFPQNPVWAYAWALHAAAAVLAGWDPPRRALAFQGCQPWLRGLGVAGVVLYAWNTGGPAGLIRWRTGTHSPCAWAGHLVAVTGVDVVTGLMGPLGEAVIRSRSCA
jgi:hypothetical protein